MSKFVSSVSRDILITKTNIFNWIHSCCYSWFGTTRGESYWFYVFVKYLYDCKWLLLLLLLPAVGYGQPSVSRDWPGEFLILRSYVRRSVTYRQSQSPIKNNTQKTVPKLHRWRRFSHNWIWLPRTNYF